MRASIISLVVCLPLIAADARSLPASVHCQESAIQYSGVVGTDPFFVSIRPDFRGLAGFSSAFVVSVTVPAGSEPVAFDSTVKLHGGAVSADLTQSRAEYWLMGRFPRRAIEFMPTGRLAALDDRGSTLYNFYYQVSERAPDRFMLQVAAATAETESRLMPEVEFRRGTGISGLIACVQF